MASQIPNNKDLVKFCAICIGLFLLTYGTLVIILATGKD